MTKTEPTNEYIFKALGVKNDLNASFKYLWPKLIDPMLMETSTGIVVSHRVDGRMTKWTTGDSPLDAIYQAYMETLKANKIPNP